MKILSQVVDTIKLHLYLPDVLDIKSYSEYVKFVDTLKSLKSEAQMIHHSNNDMRFVNHSIGGAQFRVMATTFQGFSVTIKNNDLTISFKTVNIKKNDASSDKEIFTHTHNPIIKIEFRASFLARFGHKSALDYTIDFMKKFILSDFTIKISEIHLATDIQGYNFTELDYFRFKTRKRNNVKHTSDEQIDNIYYTGRKFTGLTFGSGDEMLRIYDKTEEIRKYPDKAFIREFAWRHNPDYDLDERVWRIEIQYRRSKLKTLYTKKEGLLDGYSNILNSLPDLWGRALEIVEHKDLSDKHCIEMITGYAQDKNGYHLITKEAIKKRYQRAETSDLWNMLKTWHCSIPESVDVYKAPKTGAFQWVSNSIKSLLSTLLKYAGDLTPKILEDAFIRANDETREKNGYTLIDNAYINTLNYIANVKQFMDRNGVYIPLSKVLEVNLGAYVREVTINLFDNKYSEQRVLHLNRALQRVS
ncbi:hypothetical protein MNB_SM-7-1313 [hydrothermal vent metagenome]|uniref:Replication initiation factor n=1 Tax=hydrothermal vent metagenome TaxID=652676 RepID=A0A1W1BX88_9ZZZZ